MGSSESRSADRALSERSFHSCCSRIRISCKETEGCEFAFLLRDKILCLPALAELLDFRAC